MFSATNQDFSKLKKLVPFLVGVEEVLWEYSWQNEREATAIKIQVDSDGAGCERTRRSTSGGCITVGQHPLRTWSSTQSVEQHEHTVAVSATPHSSSLSAWSPRNLGSLADLAILLQSSVASSLLCVFAGSNEIDRL